MRPFSRGLRELFFPARCPFCGGLTDGSPFKPCPKCLRASFWLKDEEAAVPGVSFTLCASACWYEGAARSSVLRFKFGNQPELARAYGPIMADTLRRQLAGRYDVISWIPVSAETREKRGYDQARLLAEETATSLGQDVVPLLRKRRHTVPQSSLNGWQTRRKNVAGVFAPEPLPPGVRVLLVDDVLTTGATLNEAAGVLLAAGALQVCAATLCRVRPREDAP